MGCMGLSVVAGLTTVVIRVGRAICWPGWLPGPASCGGYWPTGGQGQVPGWLAGLPVGSPQLLSGSYEEGSVPAWLAGQSGEQVSPWH